MSRRMAGSTVALGRATIAGTRERGFPASSPSPPSTWAGSRRGDCGPRVCRRRCRGPPRRGPGRARRARRSRGRRPRGRGPACPTSPPATRRSRSARPGGTSSPRSRRGAPSSWAPRTRRARRGRCARSRHATSRRARPRTRRTGRERGGFPRGRPTAFSTDSPNVRRIRLIRRMILSARFGRATGHVPAPARNMRTVICPWSELALDLLLVADPLPLRVRFQSASSPRRLGVGSVGTLRVASQTDIGDGSPSAAWRGRP